MIDRRLFVRLSVAWAATLTARLGAADVDPYHLRALRHGDEDVSLSGLARGRRLVVVVMKTTSCQVCIGQLETLAKRKQALTSLGAWVVGVTHESPAKAAAVADKHALPFAVVSDPNHKVIQALGLWRARWGHPLPALVVYDRCGRERARLEGRRPGLQPDKSLLELLRKMAKHPRPCSRGRA